MESEAYPGTLCQKLRKVTIYNDLSEGLVTLFEVVREPARCEELLRRLRLTPYARQEWKRCRRLYKFHWSEITDEVERARIVYTVLRQSFVGQLGSSGGWSFGGVRHVRNVARKFRNALENIEVVAERFSAVVIECKPALWLLQTWNSPEVCVYLDPPYLEETRRGTGQYEHELDRRGHAELLEWCVSPAAQSMIVLSGYPSQFYSERLLPAGWVCEEYPTTATSAVRTLGNGLKGRSAELAMQSRFLCNGLCEISLVTIGK